MKGLLKNLGLLFILAGAITLIASAFTGNVNDNGILGGSIAAIVVGLISYIVINKRIAD
jgi:glucose uptake protein GlcU